MICGAYGLCQTTLLDFSYLCASQKLNFGYVVKNKANKYLVIDGIDVTPCPIFFESLSTFLRTRSKVKKPYCAYITDNPIILLEWDIPLIGAEKLKTKLPLFNLSAPSGTELLMSLSKPNAWSPNYRPARVIPRALTESSSKSILAPIQTALYKIKDTNARGWIQTSLFDWLAGTMSKTDFLSNLSILSDSDNSILKLAVTNPKLLELRKAAKLVLQKGISYEEAEKIHGIPDYDLKYVCKRYAKDNP